MKYKQQVYRNLHLWCYAMPQPCSEPYNCHVNVIGTCQERERLANLKVEELLPNLKILPREES